jgi:hypothetical protein
VTLIKQRLGMEAVLKPGKIGQFAVIADGKTIAEKQPGSRRTPIGPEPPDQRP